MSEFHRDSIVGRLARSLRILLRGQPNLLGKHAGSTRNHLWLGKYNVNRTNRLDAATFRGQCASSGPERTLERSLRARLRGLRGSLRALGGSAKAVDAVPSPTRRPCRSPLRDGPCFRSTAASRRFPRGRHELGGVPVRTVAAPLAALVVLFFSEPFALAQVGTATEGDQAGILSTVAAHRGIRHGRRRPGS